MEKNTWSTHPILCVFLLYLFCTSKMVAGQNIPLRVGVVLEMDDYGDMVLSCIMMALSVDFCSTLDHYKTRLVLTNRDDVIGAAASAVDLLNNIEVQAIIGPMLSGQASFLISLGNKSQVPIITFSATSPSLASTPSPYTTKDSSQGDAIGAHVKAFGWREVVPIYVDNEFGEGIIPYLTDALEHVNTRIPYRCVISPLATDDRIVAELYKLMTMQKRVFIVHMLSPLASRLFTIAKQKGMMTRDYAWIITDGITDELSSMNTSAIDSMLGVKPYVPKTKELYDITTRYMRRNNPRGCARDFNIFGLQAYDSALAAEKANLGNPKYQEANISRYSDDLEGFGISVAGSISGTTFKGLARKFDLIDGQLQSPPYETVKMVVPGARCIGYWTKEHGIVKDINFTSAKSNLGLTKWSGDVSSSLKGWVIPTNGKTLRAGVPIKPGLDEFVRVTWNSNNSTKVEGYCIDVFDAVMKALPHGVTYEFIPFATSDHDMVGDYDDYDAVAGNVTIIGNRWQYISMIAQVEDKTENSFMFVRPLTWELWITIFCSLNFVGVSVWVLEHQINKYFRHPFWYQVGMILWFAFSTIVFAYREKVVSKLTRLVLITWFMVVFILIQSYTGFFEFVRVIWNSNNTTKVEGYRIDVFNAVMASLPIGFLVWVLEHQINKYFRHPFWHQLGMTMWFAFSAFVFSHSEKVVPT